MQLIKKLPIVVNYFCLYFLKMCLSQIIRIRELNMSMAYLPKKEYQQLQIDSRNIIYEKLF